MRLMYNLEKRSKEKRKEEEINKTMTDIVT